MRIVLGLAAVLMISGCKTAGDVRSRELVERSISSKPVSEIAGCIALAAAGRQVEVRNEPLPNGVSITIGMRLTGIKTVMSVYDVENIDGARRVSFYSVGGHRELTGEISGKAKACL